MWNFIIAADNGILKPTTKLLKGSDCVDFGEKIKTLREEKGMTQQKLADQLYVTRATVSRWESGSRYPDILTTKSLADIFGTSIDELVSGESRAIDERQALLLKGRHDRVISMLYPMVLFSGILPIIICLLGYGDMFIEAILNALGLIDLTWPFDDTLCCLTMAVNLFYMIVISVLVIAGLVTLLRKGVNIGNIAVIGIFNYIHIIIKSMYIVFAPFEVESGASGLKGVVMYILTGLVVIACLYGAYITYLSYFKGRRYEPGLFLLLGVFVVISLLVCFSLFKGTHSYCYLETVIMDIGCVVTAIGLLITSAYLFNIRKPSEKEEVTARVCTQSQ